MSGDMARAGGGARKPRQEAPRNARGGGGRGDDAHASAVRANIDGRRVGNSRDITPREHSRRRIFCADLAESWKRRLLTRKSRRRLRERGDGVVSHPTARSAMAPALGKRPRSAGGAGSRATCVHGRGKGGYFCKECPGKGICEHGRRRTECKECGGGGICEHGRHRSKCKECGGSGLCEHGRQRYQCKECGGSGICEHGRQRSRCKECGGSQICEHGRRRSQCKECGGSGICEHGRQRYGCKECRAARDQAAPAPRPPVHPKPEILVEPEDVEDPGEEDERYTSVERDDRA